MHEPETFICAFCHERHPINEQIVFDGTELCGVCYDNETAVCNCCGERIWLEDAENDGDTTLCYNCYERYYSHCVSCGRIVHNDDSHYFDDDDDDVYCSHCYENARRHKTIQSYSYKPAPMFYGKGGRFLGVELEIDDGGESDANAADLMRIANENADHVYCKHDGSLDDGFEIVTHPMTLAYHRQQMPWQEITEQAASMDYRSHQAGTCGLHIHVNRDSFGDDPTMQEAAIARVLFFVENHWNELLRFSRRTQSQMEQWAARYGRKDNPKEQMEHVKKNYSDRYRAVNLTNHATIEFRMFRGTLRYNTLIATLELVSQICELAACLNDEEMSSLTWSSFCSRIGNLDYPELVQYLKERRLYVSEPVTGEEEL